MHQTIKHHGFTSDGIQRLFRDAGLEDFAFDILPEPAVFEFEEGRKERTIFIAKGRKAPTVWGKLKRARWMLLEGRRGWGLMRDREVRLLRGRTRREVEEDVLWMDFCGVGIGS